MTEADARRWLGSTTALEVARTSDPDPRVRVLAGEVLDLRATLRRHTCEGCEEVCDDLDLRACECGGQFCDDCEYEHAKACKTVAEIEAAERRVDEERADRIGAQCVETILRDFGAGL